MSTLDRNDLIGAWDLESFSIQFSDGRPTFYPYGEDAKGLICYSDDGTVSAILSASDRSGMDSVSLETARKASDTDKVAAFDSYLSYAGQFRLEENEVVHRIQFALNPAIIGTEQRRHFSYNEDDQTLTLSYHLTPASGVRRDYQLRWRKRGQHAGA